MTEEKPISFATNGSSLADPRPGFPPPSSRDSGLEALLFFGVCRQEPLSLLSAGPSTRRSLPVAKYHPLDGSYSLLPYSTPLLCLMVNFIVSSEFSNSVCLFRDL